MEWSWRTLLILLVLVLVVAIVLDGLRRMRKNRQAALKMDIDPHFPGRESAPSANPELPSGGFRVVNKHAHIEPDFGSFAPEPSATRTRSSEPAFEPMELNFHADIADAPDALDTPEVSWSEQPKASALPEIEIPEMPVIPKAQPRPINLNEAVPMLVDVDELGEDELPQATVSDPAPSQATPSTTEDDWQEALLREKQEAKDEMPAHSPALDEAIDNTPDIAEEVADLPPPIALYPVNFASPNAEKLSARPAPELVFVIHCIARPNHEFIGKKLVHLFNTCDLLFGEQELFHRFEQAGGQGAVQYSVVPSFDPQRFNPATIAKEYFRGLSFFIRLPGVKRPVEAYEQMLGISHLLAKEYQAELFDGSRCAFTQQTIEHDRQQIIEYERRAHLASMKQTRL